MTEVPHAALRRPRRPLRFHALLLLFATLCAGFTALAAWQVERRAWKHALIARVDARLRAAPIEAPGPDRWPSITATDDAYRRVVVRGTYVADRTTFVRAVTALGSGTWMLVPMRRADGVVILVNRGFVSDDERARVAATRTAATPLGDTPVVVAGLLRMSEPGGGFLQKNDPAADRWFSRDVAAIATRHGLTNVAPYFVDADSDAEARPDALPDARSRDPAAAASAGGPVGGLTVVTFTDHHLLYAMVWGCLAVLSAAAIVFLVRPEATTDRSTFVET